MSDRIYFQYDRETLYQRARECGFKCIQDYLEALVQEDLPNAADSSPDALHELPQSSGQSAHVWQAEQHR